MLWKGLATTMIRGVGLGFFQPFHYSSPRCSPPSFTNVERGGPEILANFTWSRKTLRLCS
jgi:hypothetical protein